MMLSVALCTYNGSRFIEEQIMSIVTQSVPVDEIVVCDDGSTDTTLQIIESLMNRCLFPIRIYRNEQQIGVVANFEKAISMCKGDYIFLCDQDDRWNRDKVKTIVEWYNLHPDKSVVFTDAELIDENARTIPGSKGLFYAIGFNKTIRRHFDNLTLDIFIKFNRATGATMAIRKSFFDTFKIHKTTGDSNFPLHDAQIAYGAICNGSLGYISKKLIEYRIHASQECGLGVYALKPKNDSIYNLFYSEGCQIIPEIEDRLPFLKNKIKYRNSTFGVDVYKHRKEYISHYGNQWIRFFLYDILSAVKSSVLYKFGLFRR